MYTLARFSSLTGSSEALLDIGAALNEVRAGTFSRLSRGGCWFSVDICKDSSWADHKVELMKFLSLFGRELERAQSKGVAVTIDVAVDPEDYRSATVFSLHQEPNILAAMSAAGVHFEVSIYVA
jgi:hypothetical protein